MSHELLFGQKVCRPVKTLAPRTRFEERKVLWNYFVAHVGGIRSAGDHGATVVHQPKCATVAFTIQVGIVQVVDGEKNSV